MTRPVATLARQAAHPPSGLSEPSPAAGAMRNISDAGSSVEFILLEVVMKSFHRIVVALLALGVAVAVSAQDLTGTLKKVKDTGSFTIGYRESSIPFSYLDDKQQPIGYAMELCMKVLDAVKAEL